MMDATRLGPKPLQAAVRDAGQSLSSLLPQRGIITALAIAATALPRKEKGGPANKERALAVPLLGSGALSKEQQDEIIALRKST